MPMAKPPKAAKPIAFFGQDFSGEEKNGTMNEERTATTNTIVTMNGMSPNSALLYPWPVCSTKECTVKDH